MSGGTSRPFLFDSELGLAHSLFKHVLRQIHSSLLVQHKSEPDQTIWSIDGGTVNCS
jgi:ADP-ribose pyrophosphatase YjhB (NUDIX family)